MKNKRHMRKGYTLIELTFSIAFYTMIVTIALVGFIGIFGIYNKAQSLTRTQEETRKAMDTLTRDLRQTRNLLPATLMAGQDIKDSYCLNVSGQLVGYGIKYISDKQQYILVRSSEAKTAGQTPCTDYSSAVLVTSSDVWSDKKAPSGPFPATARPLVIEQVSGSGGTGPVVWQVRAGVFRGVSAPTMPGFTTVTDQFGAGTMLQSIVVTRE
ncbi:MAG: hypothetical protein QG658_431 [Patescibacteria group bacterium]|nr:hypothetical protein [Patescibacteria group bacterium]